MRLIHLFLVLFANVTALHAQLPLNVIWSARTPRGLYDLAEAVDSGWVATGAYGWADTWGGSSYAASVIKVTVSGDTVWNRLLPGGSGFAGSAIVANHTGTGYVVSGRGASVYTNFGSLFFLDANGNEQTVVNFYGSAGGLYIADVVRSGDGGYYVIGYDYDPYGYTFYNGWLVKTNGAGSAVWTQTYPSLQQLTGVVATADGGVVVCGTTDAYTPAALKVNAQGQTVWQRTYSTPNFQLTSMAACADGGYLFAGYATRCTVLKTDGAGDSLWQRSYGAPTYWQGHIQPKDIAATPDGGALIGGSSQSEGGVLLRIEADGDSLWAWSDAPAVVQAVEGVLALGDRSFRVVGQGMNAQYYLEGWMADLRGTCPGPVPPPSGLVVQVVGNDAHLTWQSPDVDPTCSYGVAAYILYYSGAPTGPFYYLANTPSRSWVHDGVVAFSPAMRYLVQSYVGPPLLLDRLRELPAQATMEDVKAVLDGGGH